MASPLAAGFFSKGQDERLVVASANCAGRVEKSRQGGMAEWGLVPFSFMLNSLSS